MIACTLITIGVAGLLGLAAVLAYRRTRPFLPAQPREAETEPPSVRTATEAHDGAGETVVLPVVHTGADETWSPLAALDEAGSSPDLATEVELRAQLAADLNQMMADFRFDLDHIVDRACARLDPYWARVDTDTGEWPVLTDEGLHRWMAGDYATVEAL